jgi:hypothetical protein
MGNPLKAVKTSSAIYSLSSKLTKLTRDTRVLIVGCEGGLCGGALRVDAIWIVDSNVLAALERDRAIEGQRLDDASVARYKELGSLHQTSDRDTIDVVAKDLFI